MKIKRISQYHIEFYFKKMKLIITRLRVAILRN